MPPNCKVSHPKSTSHRKLEARQIKQAANWNYKIEDKSKQSSIQTKRTWLRSVWQRTRKLVNSNSSASSTHSTCQSKRRPSYWTSRSRASTITMRDQWIRKWKLWLHKNGNKEKQGSCTTWCRRCSQPALRESSRRSYSMHRFMELPMNNRIYLPIREEVLENEIRFSKCYLDSRMVTAKCWLWKFWRFSSNSNNWKKSTSKAMVKVKQRSLWHLRTFKQLR